MTLPLGRHALRLAPCEHPAATDSCGACGLRRDSAAPVLGRLTRGEIEARAFELLGPARLDHWPRCASCGQLQPSRRRAG